MGILGPPFPWLQKVVPVRIGLKHFQSTGFFFSFRKVAKRRHTCLKMEYPVRNLYLLKRPQIEEKLFFWGSSRQICVRIQFQEFVEIMSSIKSKSAQGCSPPGLHQQISKGNTTLVGLQVLDFLRGNSTRVGTVRVEDYRRT